MRQIGRMGQVSTGYPLSTDFFREGRSAVTGGGVLESEGLAKGELVSSYAKSGWHVLVYPQKRFFSNLPGPDSLVRNLPGTRLKGASCGCHHAASAVRQRGSHSLHSGLEGGPQRALAPKLMPFPSRGIVPLWPLKQRRSHKC
jgi:hypothetical protein